MARRRKMISKLLNRAKITLGVVKGWFPPTEVVRFCEVTIKMVEDTPFTTGRFIAMKENTNEGDWFLLRLFQHIDGREGFGLKHKKAIAKEVCSPSALMKLIREMSDEMDNNDLFEIFVCLDFRRHELGLFISRILSQFDESVPDRMNLRMSSKQKFQVATMLRGNPDMFLMAARKFGLDGEHIQGLLVSDVDLRGREYEIAITIIENRWKMSPEQRKAAMRRRLMNRDSVLPLLLVLERGGLSNRDIFEILDETDFEGNEDALVDFLMWNEILPEGEGLTSKQASALIASKLAGNKAEFQRAMKSRSLESGDMKNLKGIYASLP